MWRRLLYFNLILLFLLIVLRFHVERTALRSFRPTSWSEEVKSDCGIVLTGSSGRVREGVALLYKGAIRKLIISGVHPKATWREILPQWPFYGGLSEDSIVLERRSATTYGNAVQSLPLVEALHCRNVALITSTLHMHRAYKTFESVFPRGYSIFVYAVVGGSLNASFFDELIETMKSIFYSFWAY